MLCKRPRVIKLQFHFITVYEQDKVVNQEWFQQYNKKEQGMGTCLDLS